MVIDWNEILALSTLVIAIAAVIAIIVESRRTRFIHAVDLIVKLDDDFHSTEMRQLRRTAATALLDKTKTHPTDAIIILDFFEKVGCLTRYRVLDKRMVWHEMYHWIHRYYLAAFDYITMMRTMQKDDTLWEDLDYLHTELLDIEKKERRCTDAGTLLTNEELTRFLEYESNL